MSKYTTEVRYICESLSGLTESSDRDKINTVIEKSRSRVFDFDFPMFDESYRSVLETKILKHYYTREIGFETVGLWKHFMDMRMNEIMPYYNQMYRSATLEFNPFYDVDYTTSGNRKEKSNENNKNQNVRTDNLSSVNNGSSSNENTRTDDLSTVNNGNETGNTKDRYSDTPQGSLQNIDDNTYLTNARIIDDSKNTHSDEAQTGTVKNQGSENHNDTTTNSGTVKNDGSGNRDFSSTNDYLEHVSGKRGGASYSELLKQYRQTFMNIDMMIIEELGDLFMNLW